MTTYSFLLRRFLPAFVFFAALLLTSVPAGAQDVRCDLCRDKITGRYMSYRLDNRQINVCGSCARTKPKCQLCAMPHNEHAHAGQPSLCGNCRKDAKFCNICSGLITGRYSVYELVEGRDYRVCRDCQIGSPRCSSCDVPFSPKWLKAYPKSGTRWCRGCLDKADYCSTCRDPITGTYYTLEFQIGRAHV